MGILSTKLVSNPDELNSATSQLQLTHNESNADEQDRKLSNTSIEQIKHLENLKIINSGNLVSIVGNKITGDQIIHINQNSNKGTNRTPLQFGLPFVKDNVIGRDHDVEELYKLMKSAEYRPVVITGMGGVGKTTLAIHCAHVWASDPKYQLIDNIAFINAETEDSFKHSVETLAEELNVLTTKRKIKEIIREILNKFTSSSLLLIYDNIDSYSVVKEYLPENIPNIYILATSQITELKAFFHCYELNILNEADSKTLVMSVLGDHLCSERDVNKLVTIFGGLPLGLLQAAAHIKDVIENEDEDYTIQDYIKQYNEHLDEPFPDDFKVNYKYSVYIALKINIEKIKEKTTKEILWCIAYLNPFYIKEDLFHETYEGKHIKQALRALSKYSIIKRVTIVHVSGIKSKKIIIHRLLQEICRIYIENKKSQMLILTTSLTVRSVCLWQHISFMSCHIGENFFCIMTDGFHLAFSSGMLHDFLKQELELLKQNTEITKYWDAWHFATYTQHHEVISELKKRGISYDHTNCDWTPLHAAALRTSEWRIENVIPYLSSVPNVVNSQTSTGLTPINIAAALGHFINIKELIALGADINIADIQGNTPLHWAAMNIHNDVFELLINSGADMHMENHNGQVALDILTRKTYEKEKPLKVTCKQGAVIVTPVSPCGEPLEKQLITFDLLVNTDDGVKFLKDRLKYCSWWSSEKEIFKHEYHIFTHNLTSTLDNAPVALELAAAYIINETHTLKEAEAFLNETATLADLDFFLKSCSSEKFRNIYYYICLILDKIEREHPQAFHYISYVNYCDNLLEINSTSASCIGISEQELDESHKLLQNYCLIKEEWPFIHDLVQEIIHFYLTKRQKVQHILEIILKTGLNVPYMFYIRRLLTFMREKDIYTFIKKEYEGSELLNHFLCLLQNIGCTVTTEGWTALHYVCCYSNQKARLIISRLVELKVDINISVSNIRPIHLASVQDPSRVDSHWCLTVLQENQNIQQDVKTNEGFTPLHLAVITHNSMFQSRILKAGADINATDNWGNTPTHYAAKYGDATILSNLLINGADLTATNMEGETPVDLLPSNIKIIPDDDFILQVKIVK